MLPMLGDLLIVGLIWLGIPEELPRENTPTQDSELEELLHGVGQVAEQYKNNALRFTCKVRQKYRNYRFFGVSTTEQMIGTP